VPNLDLLKGRLSTKEENGLMTHALIHQPGAGSPPVKNSANPWEELA
jgi:hypothetical protein